MKKKAEDIIVNGTFYKINVSIVNKNCIKIYNSKNVPFGEFKSTCDIIVKYCIDEGFINIKLPFVEVISKNIK